MTNIEIAADRVKAAQAASDAFHQAFGRLQGCVELAQQSYADCDWLGQDDITRLQAKVDAVTRALGWDTVESELPGCPA